VRIEDVEDALVDREPRAGREDQDRDDEAPEIKLAPVTERMLLVGRQLAALLAVEQQNLVDAVDHRMDALGQHRRRSAESRRHELGHRNAEVRPERCDEHHAIAARHQSRRSIPRQPPTTMKGSLSRMTFH
jgi:hypothetical protein